ncbi:MAG: amidohydrolase [Anaeromyxobacteraceae bacterium]
MKTLRVFLAVLAATVSLQARAEPATVYFNGDILTMEGESPRYVEAVVVTGDKITFAGAMPEALAAAGPGPVMKDLKGHTLLPGFIDSWGHFALVAQDTLGVNLAYFSATPPRTRAQVIDRLRKEGKPFNGWLIGTGYSDAMLSDGAVTRADLDEVFPDQPVLIENISTLTGMVNSAGLRKLGITKATKPVSGFIPRDPKTGRLTGELVGGPYLDAVARAVGKYAQDLTFETYRKAEGIYAENGFTTAQSYAASQADMRDMRAASDQGVVSIDLIALPEFDTVDAMLDADPKTQFGAYSRGDRGFKVAGMMVPTDGAPQLRFAWFTKPYADTTGFGKGWRGFAYNPQGTIDRCARLAYEKGIQYFGYSNGDAGIDMTLAAIAKAIRETGVTEDRRTVISHSMFVRDDQLAQYKDKNVMAIALSNHVWLYGDVYPRLLGEERARNVLPLRSAQEHGVRIGIHNDTPSSGPSAMFTIWSAVNRKTFGGKTLGPEQRIDPYAALQGFTTSAAYQYREESSKGTIAPGKLADLVELDRNPLEVEPDDIRKIRVVRTVKHGKQIYERGE